MIEVTVDAVAADVADDVGEDRRRRHDVERRAPEPELARRGPHAATRIGEATTSATIDR